MTVRRRLCSLVDLRLVTVQTMDRLAAGDVRYRFVLDTSALG